MRHPSLTHRATSPADGQRQPPEPFGAADNVPARRSMNVRTVWISDVHLGTPGCQAHALLDFLRHVECQQMYLVGDIIDGWQLKRSWHWPQAHSDVIQKLLRKVRKGTRMTFIAGNHDEFARRFLGVTLGGIEVADEAVHTTADGKRLWILHGDQFDGVIQCAKWLAHVGDVLYEFSLKLNRHLNICRAWLGLPYWSISQYFKLKVKRAVSYVGDFENAVAREARQRGMDGVVCGHIHHAEMRDIQGILYANDGDWVESLSALVEHADGRLEIVRWPMSHAPRGKRQPAVQEDPLHLLDDLELPVTPLR
ncbi:UDP-2,3-diacylglucosamine pyrophosphatase LpxH [Comamonas sp. BIGb0124]|uniref:UDP-2,3-diacylglucosamine diphosphatase n=1 Tax=Comamonas sp. BIGb0124 TaxID=2485130 RepID=UPI000F92E427|nr:UDP-2,3-diacylglucosamine pyrophosphatase LpxH [Comamonas sp. BIGb0124]